MEADGAASSSACKPGEGLCTDMRAVRKDYFLDHDHSAYVDQWDWERAITAKQRNLEFLKDVVEQDLEGAEGRREASSRSMFPKLKDPRYPNLPEKLTFLHAEEILDMYPDLPRKQRETAILQEYPAVFIIGIGWTLEGRLPARDARRRLRRLGHRDAARQDGQADARAERRHPGLEPGDQAAPRADLDGHPRDRGDAEAAARDDAASSTS